MDFCYGGAMIPITVITGFLGAGKTSLIAHLLDSTEERSIAVIVNDMAPESLDSAFLRGGEHIQSGDAGLIRTITGGRAGAGKEEAVVVAIQDLAGLDPPPEAIVLETSGSSPVLQLTRLFQEDPRLSALVTLDSVITVVDTSAVATWWGDTLLQPMLKDQLQAADLVVLNKYDRASWFGRLRARRIARARYGSRRRQLVAAEFGRLPPDQVVLTGRRSAPGQTGAAKPAADSSRPFHQPLVVRHLDDRRPLHPQRFEQWLNGGWEGIIRVKGFFWLATDMVSLYVVDGAGPQREIGLEGTWYGALDPADVPADSHVREALAAGPYQDRRQAITIIGVPDAVEREMRNLRAALLTVTEMDRGPQGWAGLPDPISGRFLQDEVSPGTAPSPQGVPQTSG